MLTPTVIFVFVVCLITSLCEGDESFALCQNHNGFIRCSGGKLIRIISAKYGRTDSKVCPVGKHSTRKCHSASSTLSKVRWSCNGYKTCHLSAANKVFGNPCSGITKYLEVKFRCQRPKDILPSVNARFTIAFHAMLSSTVKAAKGTVLKFAKVITNNGKAYNPNTGKFVAPRAGTYRFDWSYLVHKSQHSFVCGTVNGKRIQNTAVSNQFDHFDMASGFMIVQLKKKDEVYLQAYADNTYLYADLNADGFSFFGGHMI